MTFVRQNVTLKENKALRISGVYTKNTFLPLKIQMRTYYIILSKKQVMKRTGGHGNNFQH